MKTKYKILSLIFALVLVTPVLGLAAVDLDDPAHHEKLAASYEEKALTQDALILEHEQMKTDFAKSVATSPKGGLPPSVKAMEKHCDAIIKDASNLKAELLDFAKWHRMRAAELAGR